MWGKVAKNEKNAISATNLATQIDTLYKKAEFLLEKELIIELKSVEALLPVHEAQLISYLKLADKRMGFLINFNVPIIKSGFKRFVNNY